MLQVCPDRISVSQPSAPAHRHSPVESLCTIGDLDPDASSFLSVAVSGGSQQRCLGLSEEMLNALSEGELTVLNASV